MNERVDYHPSTLDYVAKERYLCQWTMEEEDYNMTIEMNVNDNTIQSDNNTNETIENDIIEKNIIEKNNEIDNQKLENDENANTETLTENLSIKSNDINQDVENDNNANANEEDEQKIDSLVNESKEDNIEYANIARDDEPEEKDNNSDEQQGKETEESLEEESNTMETNSEEKEQYEETPIVSTLDDAESGSTETKFEEKEQVEETTIVSSAYDEESDPTETKSEEKEQIEETPIVSNIDDRESESTESKSEEKEQVEENGTDVNEEVSSSKEEKSTMEDAVNIPETPEQINIESSSLEPAEPQPDTKKRPVEQKNETDDPQKTKSTPKKPLPQGSVKKKNQNDERILDIHVPKNKEEKSKDFKPEKKKLSSENTNHESSTKENSTIPVFAHSGRVVNVGELSQKRFVESIRRTALWDTIDDRRVPAEPQRVIILVGQRDKSRDWGRIASCILKAALHADALILDYAGNKSIFHGIRSKSGNYPNILGVAATKIVSKCSLHRESILVEGLSAPMSADLDSESDAMYIKAKFDFAKRIARKNNILVLHLEKRNTPSGILTMKIAFQMSIPILSLYDCERPQFATKRYAAFPKNISGAENEFASFIHLHLTVDLLEIP